MASQCLGFQKVACLALLFRKYLPDFTKFIIFIIYYSNINKASLHLSSHISFPSECLNIVNYNIEKYIQSMSVQRFLNPEGSAANRQSNDGHVPGKINISKLEAGVNTLKMCHSVIENAHKLQPSRKPGSKASELKGSLAKQSESSLIEGNRVNEELAGERSYVLHLQKVLSTLQETYSLSMRKRQKNKKLYKGSLESIYRVRDDLKLKQKDLAEQLQILQELFETKCFHQ